MENNEPLPLAEKRKLEEDHTPMWVKFFGGTIMSIAFLCVITLTGYIVTNLNNLQMQLNAVNSDMISKKDFTDKNREVWTSIKLNGEATAVQKERMNSIEQVAKERQIWMDKYEIKIAEQTKALEAANKEIVGQKERCNSTDAQILLLREENKQLQKDLQLLREKFAAIEAKTKKE